ncbi:obscurin-like protein 1 isoform X15 [Colossoma macropomum]|uniref:obscurin-like protein 1 isoform X15 n=1 Tax=Colossoma macropomum TaxID=42526 RepID=UPI0018645A3B|nr:obscurin-like protein 1 isoform X15 [Colossoma macropomum]
MDVFGGAPRFLAYPRPVVVQSGTDAVLKCQIGGDPRPAVIWERNNEKIHPGGRYRVFEDGNVYNLIITLVTAEDSGQYICKAKNSIGETYAAATLKVEGEAQEMELREENKPRFLIKPLSTRVGRGEDAVFSCKLWGNPRPEVVWEKDGKKLNEIFESTHFSVGYQDGGWFQLKIFKTRAPDGGVYTCKARNEFGESLAGAVLLVDAGPGHEDEGNRNGYSNGHWKAHQGKQRSGRQVSTRLKDEPLPNSAKVKMFAVTEGKHAKFRCYVTGKPKPEIIWRKDGRLILSGRRYLLYEDREGYFTLKVLYCKQQDNGVYVCAASNTAGQTLSAVHLSVKEPPVRFKQPLSDLQVWERDLAILECEVPEDSVPITWYLEDRRLQPGAKYGMEEWGTKRRLTIRDIGIDDDGIYLCEMADGGRSIAEVAVKGTIVRKLPRKVDVLEGENAAFCVEVEEEEMDIHWYKDGVELRETHQTILKSFGRTHILVFVNTTPHDSGMVIFYVGRSKTSSQLRVKAARHCPPSCPIGVQINTERANAALLSWVPAQDCRKNPPSGYILERQEMGSQEWLQCLTTDSATSVEILGDSVPCEADYRFRICSINKYGRSGYVEFPRAVHLVPVAKIQAPLQDALVPEGQDACFSIELSASVIGTWFLNGNQLQEDERFSIRRSRTHQSLRIRGVRDTDNGAEITFIAYGIRDSAALYIQAPLVKFTPLSEMDRNKFVEVGNPIVLYCELSDPEAQVRWYKNGIELHSVEGLHIQSEGTMRRIVIQSAEFSHSGVYTCDAIDDVIRFNVEVEAPPVTFVYMPEEELHRNIMEQDNLFLCCEVSRFDAATQWYKDGVEIQPSDKVLIETENTIRKLIIQSVQLSDAGVYTCRAGDNALIFKVNVREPPVMIVYPKEDVHLDRHVPEEVVLSCELSRPNGKVTWLKDGQKLQESENIKLKTEGPYRRLKILHSRVEDSGEYVCDTADDSKFFYLSIKEPPVRIVSPSQSQMELCQQTSERMVLSCEISRPNASVRWYRDGLEVEENNNLILEVDGVYRRLIIPETTVSDSAEYVCDTAEDSVTFFVNIAEPPVRFIRPRKMAYEVEKFVGDTVVLDCEVSRSNAEVSWKKNGEEIDENSNITITEDGSSRQLTIHSAVLEDTGQYVCDAKDDVMDFHLKILEPPIKFLQKADISTDIHVVVSDAIVLKCELSRANGVVQWYKDNERIVGNEHFICEEKGAFRSLIVLNAEIRDSGEYVCDAKDDKTVFNVTVQEAPVSILGNSGNPEHYTLVAGDELILACEVSRENAFVQWLCNGRVLQADSRTHIESRGTMRKFVLSSLDIFDSGEYVCDATDDKMTTIVTVQEPPLKFIKKEERTNITAYEEDSVTLCAIVNRDNAPVKWLKDGDQIRDDRFCTTTDGCTHYLTINPLKRSDAGEYICDVGTDEIHFSVHVKAMKVKFSKPLENIVGLKDNDVVLRCELYKSKGDVQWLKNNQEITPNRHFTIRADGRERSLTIHNVTDDDAGEYACESKDERTSATVVVESPRIVEFIAELHNITVMEGEDATFKCVVSPEDAELVWCMNGWPIISNERFNISSNGLCHMLHINNCQVSDSCRLTAEAEGVISKAILQVQEAQVLFTKKMESVVAEEYGEATLEVEVSLESGEVQWMRQGVVIHPGPKFTLKQSGQKRSLTIHKLALSDRGMYSCETLHDRTQAKLSVEPRKIKIRKGLSEVQTFERETASFEVELSHSNVEGAWQKDGSRLKNNNHWRMTAKGHVHSLTISNLSLEDTGTYTFSAENVRSSARLIVKETPVSILKKLEDSTFPEGTGATLECELSRHNVDVKWTKNGLELKSGKNLRIYSMGRKRFLQILRCELGDSGVYVCDAGDATTSCSVEVYERELEVLQSLEDLDIQEDQNAVFMCEVSLDDVPGEWFKNGEKIKPTSTIKIRQEGTKHFLLMCNVKGEDSGEIKFVAKNVESTAYLEVEELPVSIVKPLQDKTALEKSRVILDCTVSNPRCSIRWYKGRNVILPSERFEICSEGCYRKLVIQQVALEDEGTYSVQVGDYTCSARLTVEAQSILMVQDLQDVEVKAPEEACFACEVSVPVLKAPVWTLNGEVLQPGPRVLLEKMGTVHRLTLRQTSEDMSGVVEFVSGKAKSTAKLHVKE